MSALENEFTQELIKRTEEAAKACGYNPARFVQAVEKNGGVRTAKSYISRNRTSEGFEKLQMCGKLDLSMEAVVVDKKYAALFTDDEVNSCFMLLCEYGFYK